MSRFRLFLACLLMAALPMQGMAAASMLFCGSQAAARVAQAVSHHGQPASMDASAVDHASHGHGAHGSSHGHAAAQADADQAASHSPDDGSRQGHSCPICASCSQSQAVGGFASLPLASPAPAAEPWQPPVRVSSRTLTLPDKPPRG
ncbi:MAG TPA: hypothetical protein VIL30_23580 [Ramlibacter sp.]